ncbi:MAG: hypothetical protein MK086_06620 [Flavobacteriales bacterium]|nr:hypothetical protein [Flavobacteriales bacterium]
MSEIKHPHQVNSTQALSARIDAITYGALSAISSWLPNFIFPRGYLIIDFIDLPEREYAEA